jgi:glucokinase
MQALALDMGGTHIGCGVVEGDRLLAETSIDEEGASSFGDLPPVVEDAVRVLLREAGTYRRA